MKMFGFKFNSLALFSLSQYSELILRTYTPNFVAEDENVQISVLLSQYISC